MFEDCEICQYLKTGDSSMLVKDAEYWRIILRDDQEYLGTCFVTLKRHAGKLYDLSSEEVAEYTELQNSLIRAYESSFGSDVVNVSCLMNNAYRVEHPSPHIHYHFKPRYKNKVTVGDEEFEDKQFGNYIVDKYTHITSPESNKLIIEKLVAYL